MLLDKTLHVCGRSQRLAFQRPKKDDLFIMNMQNETVTVCKTFSCACYHLTDSFSFFPFWKEKNRIKKKKQEDEINPFLKQSGLLPSMLTLSSVDIIRRPGSSDSSDTQGVHQRSGEGFPASLERENDQLDEIAL